MKKYLIMLLALPIVCSAKPTALAVAASQNVTTQIMQPTDINSAHGINLTNDTTKPQMFYWTITLCPDTQPERCQSFSDHTSLYPGQKWSKVYNLKSTIVFKAIGSKSVTAKTEITGAAYSLALDQKYVDVHY